MTQTQGITQSEQISNLMQALSSAQSEFTTVEKNKKGYNYMYADFAAVVAMAKPILARHGLCVTQLLFGSDGAVGVKTQLSHTSGEWISSSFSVGKDVVEPRSANKNVNMMQVVGSNITYLRRYSYSSILGIVSDEDVDASTHSTTPSSSAMPSSRKQYSRQPSNAQPFPKHLEEFSSLSIEGKKNKIEEAAEKLNLHEVLDKWKKNGDNISHKALMDRYVWVISQKSKEQRYE